VRPAACNKTAATHAHAAKPARVLHSHQHAQFVRAAHVANRLCAPFDSTLTRFEALNTTGATYAHAPKPRQALRSPAHSRMLKPPTSPPATKQPPPAHMPPHQLVGPFISTLTLVGAATRNISAATCPHAPKTSMCTPFDSTPTLVRARNTTAATPRTCPQTSLCAPFNSKHAC
jgi:hypothetical protein